MPMMTRGNERIAVEIAVTVTTVLDCVDATVVNLSEDGAMIAGTAAPPRSQIIIDCVGQSVFGTVMWSEDDRFGIRFPFALSEGPLFHALEAARTARLMPGPYAGQPVERPQFGRRSCGSCGLPLLSLPSAQG